MEERETPCSYAYGDLKEFGGIKYKDAAEIMLSSRTILNGRSPRSRIGERSFLSRTIVHATPADSNPALYGDNRLPCWVGVPC